MKALIVHNVLWSHYKGAVFTALDRLAKDRGIDVAFIQIAQTFSERKTLSEVDLSYHQYSFQLLFDCAFDEVGPLRRSLRLVRAAAASGADIVVLPGYEDLSYWMLWLYCIVTGKRRIITLDSTLHDHPRRWYKELVKKLYVAGCSGAFCYGQRSAQYVEMLGMPADRITRRCQAAPNERLLVKADEIRAAALSGAVDLTIRKRFLFVGRLSPEKGLRTLLYAFQRFCARHADFELLIVGNGAQREELEALAGELQLQAAVRFAGPKPLDDLVIDYMTAYALVLPSTSEPWGLVVNEAFLMGCPAVVSAVCGCAPDLVFDGLTGYQFEADNVDSLLEALEKMAAQSARRAEMGEQCARVIAGFTPEEAARQMLTGLCMIGAVAE